jgi:hypothetical protein
MLLMRKRTGIGRGWDVVDCGVPGVRIGIGRWNMEIANGEFRISNGKIGRWNMGIANDELEMPNGEFGRYRTPSDGKSRYRSVKKIAGSVGIVKTLSLDGWICRLYR